MKILSIKFKNINSLAGEWEIDFTRREFVENGIFAITGKTGSGKSSILDAIAIALYGKTPRIDITGSKNEVMTRGTKDCYSEITFQIDNKIWKVSWKQECTRTGKLKQVERSLADADNKIIADKATEVNKKIVNILGLTFEQFTKVILLAQGSFAAFLQANKNDKGALLEQITGTEIYGDISKKIFERHKTEKEKLNRLQIQLDATKILEKENIDKLNSEIANFKIQKHDIDTELKNLDKTIKRIEELAQLKKEIEAANLKIPVLEQQKTDANIKLEESLKKLHAAKAEKTETDKIIVKVRSLDTQIFEKEKSLVPISSAIKTLCESQKALAEKINQQKETLAAKKVQLKKTQTWLEQRSLYKSLHESYQAIENQDTLVTQQAKEYSTKEAELKNATNDLQTKTAQQSAAIKAFKIKEERLAKQQEKLETQKKTLSAILENKELVAYQQEKDKTTNLSGNIKDLIAVENKLLQNKKKIEIYSQTIINLETDIKKLTTTIDTDKSEAEKQEKQIHLLEENLRLIETIKSLNEHRKALKDGTPCPLCGATEHPFAIGNIPQIGEKERELNAQRLEYKTLLKNIQANDKNNSTFLANKQNAITNKKNEQKEQTENTKNRDAIITAIKQLEPDFSISSNLDVTKWLKSQLAELQTKNEKLNSIINNATNIERQIQQIRDVEIPQLETEQKIAENTKTARETAQKLIEQKEKGLKESLANLEQKYNTANNNLQQKFAKYQVKTLFALKKCLQDWNTNTKQKEDLTNANNELEAKIKLDEKELTGVQKSTTEKQMEKETIDKALTSLNKHRIALFGTKKVEEAEKRLSKVLSDAEKAKETAEKAKNNANTELEKNKAVIAEKNKEHKQKQEENQTEISYEELQHVYISKKNISDELLQKIGANQQTIAINEKNISNNRQVLQQKEEQQKVSNKWGILNDLIGSQDGKKYRNFAQALTFEHLIQLANIQLQKMSERYLLKRIGDASNPFDLSVIDRFQNNDERTAQNLSGGEKFIVSLSMALGLANMASKNMKIDTMFIDEGFGTLDADYLDVALSALSNLQNEGKLIGVISHLSELKERIVTHIEVSPKGNGHSQIEIR